MGSLGVKQTAAGDVGGVDGLLKSGEARVWSGVVEIYRREVVSGPLVGRS